MSILGLEIPKLNNQISIFEIFKIGVGPSSSHTLGPWKAALDLREMLTQKEIEHIQVLLYGSLSKTGKGHKTDTALVLGLLGCDPVNMDTNRIPDLEKNLEAKGKISIGLGEASFTPSKDILFTKETLNYHPNSLEFHCHLSNGTIEKHTYCSLGGGFIQKVGEAFEKVVKPPIPYPVQHGKDLLEHKRTTGLNIVEITHQNELVLRTEEQIEKDILHIYATMMHSIYTGCSTTGQLPGGLQVRRRAKGIFEQNVPNAPQESFEEWIEHVLSQEYSALQLNLLVSCFAMAVNEENAAMGRIVTSPTNGSAGVIPAVLLFFQCYYHRLSYEEIKSFFYVAGEIGCIYKKNATISAAQGGCQAEIGVSSSMAAAGLCYLKGGSFEQVLMAAEIAMEHHLGLTCDPIGGLVQVPCIERNSMGAIKAITAAQLALNSKPEEAIVNFDAVVQTMWETAKDINDRYKETSEGGLAVALPLLMNC